MKPADSRAGWSVAGRLAWRLLAFITAKMKFFIYGPYDASELWRVNLTGFIGLVGLAWVLFEHVFHIVGMLVLQDRVPMIAIIPLSGASPSITGRFRHGDWSGSSTWSSWTPRHSRRVRRCLCGCIWGCWLFLVIYAAVMLVLSADVGLPAIDTNDWGGLLITLVVAVMGIVASAFGIVLALGRRSSMPVARILSVVFMNSGVVCR